jgi:DNA-binding MarR family transcriptional regulator
MRTRTTTTPEPEFTPASTTAPPERAFDRLLTDLEERNLTPREARVLLWLTERDATPDELADALEGDPRATRRAVKRLERRGLVRRSSGAARGPHSLLGATVAGLRTLRPLVEHVSGTGDSHAYSLWRGRRR